MCYCTHADEINVFRICQELAIAKSEIRNFRKIVITTHSELQTE